MIKNFFGIEAHYTDRFIHWSELRGPNGMKRVLVRSQRLREVYDRLVLAGFKDDVEELIDAAWTEGHEDGLDSADY